MKVIVIGGVAAGMSAASKIKRLRPDAQVTVYEKGGFLSYGACGLPYYVGGFNDDYRRMIARSQERFEKDGIRTFLYHEVTHVDPVAKEVVVRNVETGAELRESYDSLMVATGAAAVIPPIPGREMLGVHALKTLDDGIFLREYAQQSQVQNVVIVGGGYIGIECAEAFLHLGKQVRVIEASPRILSAFDPLMSEQAAAELVRHGAAVHVGESVKAFVGQQTVTAVQTDKDTYPADLVIVAVGVRPSTEFLADTGIQMAPNGALVVDRMMRTSLPDVYSAGDCSMSYNRLMEENSFLALGTVANKCGRIAGANIAGQQQEFAGALATAAIKVCDLEIGTTGLSEEQAQQRGMSCKSVVVESFDHPGYYPDQTPILIKLVYEVGTRRILGAQLCGPKGAVLRADIFAVAIHGGMTTDELGMVDLAYAPPFAGVWDAVHIACNAAK